MARYAPIFNQFPLKFSGKASVKPSSRLSMTFSLQSWKLLRAEEDEISKKVEDREVSNIVAVDSWL